METAAVPRLSATVLIVRDDPFEVLMMRRSAHGTFPSALVFPGGAVDPGDLDGQADDAVGAEPGILNAAVRETWEEVGVRLDPADLHPFAHWVTPAGRARRFDTHFYLARMPVEQSAVADGTEALTAEWVEPAEGVDRHLRGDEDLVFPTLLNLMRLAQSTTVDEAIAAATAREPFTVQPVMTRTAEGTSIAIPEGAGYPLTVFPASGSSRLKG